MQQTGKQNTLEFTLDIPAGLTLVAGSGVAADKAILGWDSLEWTAASLFFNGYGSNSFTGTEKVTVFTFKCTVDSDAALKNYDVTLVDLVADDDAYVSKNPTVIPATISVEAKPIAVTGVTLTESATLAEGETITLSYEVLPADASNKSVTFKSSDNTIATVDANGKVTAVKEGTVTITVTTADGSFTDTCAVTVTKAPCTHTSKTATAAKTATCVEGGWAAYSTCDECGQLFDALGAMIAEIPATPVSDEHNYGTLIPAAAEVHTATELKAAVDAHYICSVCDKYFTEGKVETTLNDLTGTAPEHAYNDGWKTDDTNHWHDCDCGKTVDTAKHSWKWVIDKAATTTETGLKHEECTICALTRNEDTVINKITNSHSHKYSAWKYNSHIHWMVCDCGLVHENADSHTWIWNTAKFPTKTETGLKYQACYYCGARQNVNTVIPKLEADHTHKYDATKADKNGHWTECACGVKTEVKKHTFVWVIDVEATETATGLKHEECSVCKFKQNENTVVSVIKPADKPADTTVPSDTSIPADTKKPTGNNSAQTGDLNIVAVMIIAGIAVLGAGTAFFFGKKARVR
ncbi:MAG: Ig domain-containing protein [Clostridia bacterium]|nr:Ig domain-containing protein [Clostridia bacterium]